MSIYHYNTKITNINNYTTPILQVWYGGSKVWEKDKDYTYKVSDPYLYYSSGTYLKSDGSNYARITAKLEIYINGVLSETKPTWLMDVTGESSITRDYLTYTDNKISFNVDKYGTTDMSYHNNPITIAIIPSAYGVTCDKQYVSVEPNTIVSTSLTDYTCSATTNVSFLTSGQTSFTVTNKNTGEYTTKYTSGKQTTETKGLEGYFYKVETTTSTNTLLATMEANGSATINVGSTNTLSYPRVFTYRFSKGTTTTGYDDFIYIMQKSGTNTTGLQLYWGTMKINNDTTLETSTFFYLENNGHTATSTYTYGCDDSNVIITQHGGVFLFENVNSSSDFQAYIRDNSGNQVTFYVRGS